MKTLFLSPALLATALLANVTFAAEADALRTRRVCSAMKSRSELTGLAGKFSADLSQAVPQGNFSLAGDALLEAVHSLSSTDRSAAATVACRWNVELSLRYPKIKSAYVQDVMSIYEDGDAQESAASILVYADAGELPQIYCQHTRAELERASLPGAPRYTYADQALSMLIENLNRTAQDGKSFETIAWFGFQKAYGISAESCR